MPNAVKQIWSKLTGKLFARFKKKNQPQAQTTSPQEGNKNIFIAKRLAAGALLFTLLFIIAVVVLISVWKPWKSIGGKIRTTASEEISARLPPASDQVQLAKAVPMKVGPELNVGQNDLKKGYRYMFYRSIQFGSYLLSPWHEDIRLHCRKEEPASTADCDILSADNDTYWDLVFREDGSSYVDRATDHRKDVWGTFYLYTDEDITIDIRIE